MSLFDLLLILLVLGTAASTVTALVALVLRRWIFARRLALSVILVWALYLGIGTAVAISAPQHIMALGEDRCFDEMCYAVTGWNRTLSTSAGRSFYLVDVRIANRSRGRAQREVGRKAYSLIDLAGSMRYPRSEWMPVPHRGHHRTLISMRKLGLARAWKRGSFLIFPRVSFTQVSRWIAT